MPNSALTTIMSGSVGESTKVQIANTKPTVILENGETGSIDDLKKLEDGTIVELSLKPKAESAEAVYFIANFCSTYTAKPCPPSHRDCCFMFRILEAKCPENLTSWLSKSYFSLDGHQFRHLDDFDVIRIVARVTIKAEIIKKLYQERKNLESQLKAIENAAAPLIKLLGK